GEPWMRANACNRLAVVGDASGVVQRLERPQEIARLGERRSRRKIEPTQHARVAYAPVRQLDRGRREIRFDDLGRRLRGERRMLAFGPKAVAHAGGDAPGAATPLVCGSSRDANGLESTHARRWIEPRAASESRIDDDAHAFDREAGFGDVGGEHDLALARRARANGCVLVVARELPVKRRHAYAAR